jgi:hypothetical protein
MSLALLWSSAGAQVITVTKPSAGELWIPGKSYVISWTKEGNMSPTVRVVLRDAATGNIVREIAAAAPNSGTLQWTVPGDIPDGTRYVIRIRAVGETVRGDSAEFKIQKPVAMTGRTSWLNILHPADGETWTKTRTQAVQWKLMGPAAKISKTVRIALMDESGRNQILKIADSAPDSGSFDWGIPASVPDGNYRIQVKSLETNIQATGAGFRILERQESMDRVPVRRVVVTSPRGDRRFKNTESIPLEWETDLRDILSRAGDNLHFTIEVFDSDGGEKVATLLKTIPNSTFYKGGNRYASNGMWADAKTGYYKFKVTPEKQNGEVAGIAGFSEKFFVTRGTEKVEEQLRPQIRDRHSRRWIDTDKDHEPISLFSSREGLARVGWQSYRYPSAGSSGYFYFILRSGLKFQVEPLRRPGRLLLKATLRLKAVNSDSHDADPPCGGKLYYLTSAWSGDCIDTPGYAVAEIPNQETGFLDVTQYVQNWYTGSEPNNGFILGSKVENFDLRHTAWCATWYEPVLFLEFLQEKE